MIASLLGALAAALVLASPAAAQNTIPEAGPACDEATLGGDGLILVFSETAAFRHDSIEDGVDAVCEIAADEGIAVDHTEDSSDFTDEPLDEYDAVVFLSTTGDVLTQPEQDAFEAYIQSGGGYAGIHAASDTEYDWAWYGDLVGAYFDSHPQNQTATVKVSDDDHPSTADLPQRWERFDEWYNFQSNPRGDVHVLATLDESSYDPGGGAMGADHPTAWCHPYDGGRSWYTGGGHTSESYDEPEFRDHILGGIMWAGGFADGECGGTIWDNFQRTTLAIGQADAGEPIGLTVLPDRSVLHTARDGTLFHTDADGNTHVAAEIPVYSYEEDGLQALTLDPAFEENNWVYIFYSPELDTPPGEAPHGGEPADWEPYEGVNHLSRFKWDPAAEELDLASEQVLLEVDQDRGMCCHLGGDFAWDPAGNLYLSTGDDTDPFESNGYAPIDERSDRNPAYDAQRTSANTNDLRGKILRITPNAKQGGYSIPDGNLFAEGADGTRPEVYAMGFRNPFRIEINRDNDELYVGDYSPDARNPDPDRGPSGQGKWTIVREPANYGWPYCATAELPYVDGEFVGPPDPSASPEFVSSGEEFDCANPVNESPNNTGLTELPPVTQPDVWYGFGPSAEFPELGTGGIGPMAGPAYDFDPAQAGPPAWPEYYDGVPLFYEWTRDYIKEFRLNEAGEVAEINPVLDTLGPNRGDDATLDNGMDLEFGPAGNLYTLEYGDGFFSENPDAQLGRIDYIGPGGNHAPQVQASADPESGFEAPLTVEFSSAGTSDPDGDEISYEWYFGDHPQGKVSRRPDSTDPNPTFTYRREGVYLATLNVTDEHGRSASNYVVITVGNQPPEVEFVTPEDGDEFAFGDAVEYEVQVTDEAEIDCDQVEVEYLIGHDTHTHSQTTAVGCTGTIQTSEIGGHDPAVDDLAGVFLAEYTDPGGLTGEAVVALEPTG